MKTGTICKSLNKKESVTSRHLRELFISGFISNPGYGSYTIMKEISEENDSKSSKNVKSIDTGLGGIPSGGLNLVSGSQFVSLQREVFFRISAWAAKNTEMESKRTLGFYQPLLRVNRVETEEFIEKFDKKILDIKNINNF